MSRNFASERHVSRIDDTNIWALATRSRGCRIARATAQLMLVDPGAFAYADSVAIASHQCDTEPAFLNNAIAGSSARFGSVRVPAELGHVRLARDGLGAWRYPVRPRYLPCAPSNS